VYGFVQFSSKNEADTALQKMDGQLLDGRNTRVHYASIMQAVDEKYCALVHI